jgi:hypothetical protein
MVTPSRMSAASIVRFWCVTTMNCVRSEYRRSNSTNHPCRRTETGTPTFAGVPPGEGSGGKRVCGRFGSSAGLGTAFSPGKHTHLSVTTTLRNRVTLRGLRGELLLTKQSRLFGSTQQRVATRHSSTNDVRLMRLRAAGVCWAGHLYVTSLTRTESVLSCLLRPTPLTVRFMRGRW